MKELFLLLSLTLAAPESAYSGSDYEKLWAAINEAIDADKPQEAVNLLGKLEQTVLAAGDTLELLEVRKVTLEQIGKYDWKEARKYQSSFYELDERVNAILDHYIEANPYHPRVGELVYRKIQKLKRQADSDTKRSEEQYRNIRKMCVLAAETYPQAADKFQSLIDAMDSESLTLSVGKTVLYPGQTAEFEVSSRNVSSAELSVFSLGERYLISDPSAAAGELEKTGTSRKVDGNTISGFAARYNISEKLSFSHLFEEPGIYLVMLRSKEQVCSQTIYVSSVAMAVRELGSKRQVYVADAQSGLPASEATIYAFNYKEENVSGQEDVLSEPLYVSDKKYAIKGFTTLTQSLFGAKSQNVGIFAEVGPDRYCAPLSLSKNSWRRHSAEKSYTRHYIFTDRKLYRPGDTIHFKLIALSTNGESGNVLSGKKVSLSLFAPGEEKAAVVVELTTNSMGSAAGSFLVPEGNRNGRYRIVSDEGSTSVRVEEYKDPGFRIELPAIETELVFGSRVVQGGVAKGYAGNPVGGARVEYEVEKRTYWYGGSDDNDRVVAEGVVFTDAGGNFEVPFVPEAPSDKRIENVHYTISVKVTDLSGETFSQSRTVTVARKPVVFEADFENSRAGGKTLLVNKDKAKTFTINVKNTDDVLLPVKGSFRLMYDGVVKEYGEFASGQAVELNFRRLRSGTYTLEYSAVCGDAGEMSGQTNVAFFSPNDKKSPVADNLFFYPVVEKDAIDFMVGSSGELHLLVELIDGSKVVYSRQLSLNNSAERITLPYKKEYEDQVMVSLFAIKDMEEVSDCQPFSRSVPSANFEVQLNSFRDHTTPNTEETFTIKAPASEALISIYDVTTDRYGANSFHFDPIYEYEAEYPYFRTNLHGADHFYGFSKMDDFAETTGVMYMRANAAMPAMAEEEADSTGSLSKLFTEDDEEDLQVRHDFAQTLAFIPQLAVKGGAPAKVSFTTRDGLSTFRVLVLAHAKNLRSGSVAREFTVSKAVMVQPNIPLAAVEGDKIVLKVPIANMTSETVAGTASISFADEASGREYTLGCEDVKLTIPAESQETASWSIEVPDGIESLGVTVTFKSKYGSDAEKHIMSVFPDSRYVTEAESFILGKGVSKESVIRAMKKKYGCNDSHLRYEEYSTLGALKDVLTKPETPTGNNMIEWLDCLYVNQMRGCVEGVSSIDVELSQKAARRLEQLQRSDGGWGWFPCCNSSDELTMLFLDRMSYLRELGKIPRNTSINKQIEKALGYIDKRIFEITAQKNYDWRSLIYFYAARMEHPNFAMSKEVQDILLDFIKKSKQQGWKDLSIMEKAKLCTIYWATGEAATQLRLMASLRDYAVKNKTVGCYFPNAVMPFRGLLHTEIYAHSVLAQMFAEMEQKDIAQGLFQWLLLQKHNQEWKSNMASADAIYVLLKYKATDLKFGAVYYTHYSPLLEIKPSANEISVKRSWYRDGKLLNEGDKLYVGDRIKVCYDIDNTENRSFVEMKASRPACFYPVDERSYGFWNLYCSKGAGCSTYYFQVLQEEDSRWSEEFFVTQEGTFNTGIVEICSKYAPEYRGHTDAFEVHSEVK